uniref:Uncharacterized protein n=1 Tax=Rhizophora mucronata TaxID=61149 RepID=A0A2P2QGR0_RHIMU
MQCNSFNNKQLFLSCVNPGLMRDLLIHGVQKFCLSNNLSFSNKWFLNMVSEIL